MREVVEVTGPDLSRYVGAGLPIRLLEPFEARKHIRGVLKDVPHIVEGDEVYAVSHQRKRRRRHPELNRVHERSRTAHGKSGLEIARPGAVDSESAQRVRSTCIQALRQRHSDTTR